MQNRVRSRRRSPRSGGRDADRLCPPRGCVLRGGSKAFVADASPPSALYTTKKELQPNAGALLLPDGHSNPDGELPSLCFPQHPVPPGWLCSRWHRTGAPTGQAWPALRRSLPRTARPAAPAAAPALPRRTHRPRPALLRAARPPATAPMGLWPGRLAHGPPVGEPPAPTASGHA